MRHWNAGLIFDCDGTLTDSLDQALDSFHYALHKMGMNDVNSEDIKQYFGVSADKILLKLMGNDVVRGAEAFTFFLENQKTLAASTPLHAGIFEVFKELRSLSIPLGLVTGRHVSDLHYLLDYHGMRDDFAIRVADSEVAHPKPDPEGILRVVSFLQLPAAHTLYIGDSPSDIQAAHAAGAGSVAVIWDKHASVERLRAEQPTYMISHPSELLPVFREFCLKQNIPTF
jgi:HAD superfamily hydrolase (TIGR01549 family)